MIQKAIRNWQGIIAILIGLLGGSLTFWAVPIGATAADLLILRLLSVLLLLFGIDRIRIFEAVDRISGNISSRWSVKVVTDDEFDVSLPLILKAKHRIDVMQFGGAKAPDYWRHRVSEHITANHVGYYVTLGTVRENLSSEQEVAERVRQSAFKNSPSVHPLVIDTGIFWGFDILIVDEKDVLISVMPNSATKRQSTLVLEGQTEIARALVAWLTALRENQLTQSRMSA